MYLLNFLNQPYLFYLNFFAYIQDEREYNRNMYLNIFFKYQILLSITCTRCVRLARNNTIHKEKGEPYIGSTSVKTKTKLLITPHLSWIYQKLPAGLKADPVQNALQLGLKGSILHPKKHHYLHPNQVQQQIKITKIILRE